MRRIHGLILTLTLLAAAGGAAPNSSEEDFNQARLRSGQDLYEQKKYLQAIDQFRIAVFGYLDQPPYLSEGLVRLALAQAAAGNAADTDATILRFLEVERRFPSFPAPGLQSSVAADFWTLLVGRVPQPTLLSIPTLAARIETPAQKIAKLPAADRKKALEAAARREPSAVQWPLGLSRDALDRGDAKEAESWANKALALDSSSTEAMALRARARAVRSECSDALKDFAALPAAEFERQPALYADRFVCFVEVRDWSAAEGAAARVPDNVRSRVDVVRAQQKLASEQQRQKAAAGPSPRSPLAPTPTARAVVAVANGVPTPPPNVASRSQTALDDAQRLINTGKSAEAEKILVAAVKADPANRELRLRLLEAACLSRSYQTAAAQIPVVKPLTDAEASSQFYVAVVLFETGHADEARGYLERAMPKVSGPLVDEYARKILGTR